MAMNGVQMLLKQLGIDPEKLMNDLELLKTGLIKGIQDQNAKMASIEEKVDYLCSIQDGNPLPKPKSLEKIKPC